jgi:hypothetical protein
VLVEKRGVAAPKHEAEDERSDDPSATNASSRNAHHQLGGNYS